ncbi:hypothetical protein O9992_28110 [Vibrio lentus]|nr:hypothetical protein [Vibrio lentus]
MNDLGYGGSMRVTSTGSYGFNHGSRPTLLPFLGKNDNQRGSLRFLYFGVFIGLIGLLYLPEFCNILGGIIWDLANCSTFIIALSFVGLRTSNWQPSGTALYERWLRAWLSP